MTKDEIIEIANKVKLPYDYVGGGLMWLDKLEHFAKLVAYHESKRLTDVAMKAAEKAVDVAMAIEREACAKIAENRILHDENKDIKKGYLFAQQSIAQDIRTRRQE